MFKTFKFVSQLSLPHVDLSRPAFNKRATPYSLSGSTEEHSLGEQLAATIGYVRFCEANPTAPSDILDRKWQKVDRIVDQPVRNWIAQNDEYARETLWKYLGARIPWGMPVVEWMPWGRPRIDTRFAARASFDMKFQRIFRTAKMPHQTLLRKERLNHELLEEARNLRLISQPVADAFFKSSRLRLSGMSLFWFSAYSVAMFLLGSKLLLDPNPVFQTVDAMAISYPAITGTITLLLSGAGAILTGAAYKELNGERAEYSISQELLIQHIRYRRHFHGQTRLPSSDQLSLF